MESLFPGLSAAPNLHPMVVHFPIAFWLAATGAWIIALIRRSDTAWEFGLWLQSLGSGGAALAVAMGFWATEKMGHDTPGHDLVHVHRDYMLVATGVAVALTTLAWLKRRGGLGWRRGLTVISLALTAVMSMGSDRGAELVFRYGVGVAIDKPPANSDHQHASEYSHEGGSSAFHPAPASPNTGVNYDSHGHDDGPTQDGDIDGGGSLPAHEAGSAASKDEAGGHEHSGHSH